MALWGWYGLLCVLAFALLSSCSDEPARVNRAQIPTKGKPSVPPGVRERVFVGEVGLLVDELCLCNDAPCAQRTIARLDSLAAKDRSLTRRALAPDGEMSEAVRIIDRRMKECTSRHNAPRAAKLSAPPPPPSDFSADELLRQATLLADRACRCSSIECLVPEQSNFMELVTTREHIVAGSAVLRDQISSRKEDIAICRAAIRDNLQEQAAAARYENRIRSQRQRSNASPSSSSYRRTRTDYSSDYEAASTTSPSYAESAQPRYSAPMLWHEERTSTERAINKVNEDAARAQSCPRGWIEVPTTDGQIAMICR